MSSNKAFDLLRRVAEALSSAGLRNFEPIDCSGEFAYCGTTQKPNSTDGRYRFHADFPPNVWILNRNNGEKKGEVVHLYNKGAINAMSQEEREALRERIRQEREKAIKELEKRRTEAAERANRIFPPLPYAGKNNAYLSRKGVLPMGDMRQASDGRLVVPVLNAEGRIVNLQFIAGNGIKRFLKSGLKKECFFPIPARDGGKDGPLLIGEGAATVLSACMATGMAGLVAFDAGNLEAVARVAWGKYPERELVLLADNDCTDKDGKQREHNPGIEAATAASRAVGGKLAVCPAHEGMNTDFNDLHQRRSLDAVAAVIEAARAEGGAFAVAQRQGRGLRCVNAYEFLSLAFPAREMLLTPILPRQGLCMLHAMRGIGKTFISLSVAYAVASGGKVFDRWKAPRPARVLFLDGEMPARTLQERLAALVAGSEQEPPSNDYLRILTPDMQDGPMPNLATREGQEAVAPFLEDVDLVIIDNLATLARYGRSNDEESWLPVQGWLLDLRRRGLSVFMVHHQGKGGDQRGTSAKEDVLDTVIRLARPSDYHSEQGARFEVHLTKARGICGPDAKSFEAQLFTAGQALAWTTKDIEDAELDQLARLMAEGFTIRDAAEEMGISKSAAGRLKKKLDAGRADIRISQGTTFPSSSEMPCERQ